VWLGGADAGGATGGGVGVDNVEGAEGGGTRGGAWDPLPGLVWGHEKPLREFVAETRPWLPPLSVEGRV
jgi:hypothetical protein